MWVWSCLMVFDMVTYKQYRWLLMIIKFSYSFFVFSSLSFSTNSHYLFYNTMNLCQAGDWNHDSADFCFGILSAIISLILPHYFYCSISLKISPALHPTFWLISFSIYYSINISIFSYSKFHLIFLYFYSISSIICFISHLFQFCLIFVFFIHFIFVAAILFKFIFIFVASIMKESNIFLISYSIFITKKAI